MNPIIPGDHPDPTLTKVGNDFYTSGSSFNPTPKIYHSTDLVHWEVISQPVSSSWGLYGDEAGGGIWGGHTVFYNNEYWHIFARLGRGMFFVKADEPKGPWSEPELISPPNGMTGLGQDNSIFIDDDNKWYLLVKNGKEGNWLIEIDSSGQLTQNILDLTWINPAPDYPYSWAEGPVMWKRKGIYYYSFARNLGGGQYVMKSDTLSESKSDWTILGDFFSSRSTSSLMFKNPNHCSPVIELEDRTSWVISQSYDYSENNSWIGIGRQGVLTEVQYDNDGNPEAFYPSDHAVEAPDLLNSGIPWMVPHSDVFESEILDPEWSFLGYTPKNTYSLSERPGWLRLSPKSRSASNTLIKNDAEHNYTLITKMEFNPVKPYDEAGIWIFNGLQTKYAKLYKSINDSGNYVIKFNFTNGAAYETEIDDKQIIWLKLHRDNHQLSGYYSFDGFNWSIAGEEIDVTDMDNEQQNYNAFTGNQQGLFTRGLDSYFDFYIYRDAYSPISAEFPANQYGTSSAKGLNDIFSLSNIHNNDWALYAGVEFGNNNYPNTVDSIAIFASSAANGGNVEIWVDSIDVGRKVGECQINNTGDWNTFESFNVKVDSISGNHDVYLKFVGNNTEELFQIQTLQFYGSPYKPSSVYNIQNNKALTEYKLYQNYPNPFNPETTIEFYIPNTQLITLKIFDVLGREVATIFEGIKNKGNHKINFDGSNLSSGVYYYQLKSGNYVDTKKIVLVK